MKSANWHWMAITIHLKRNHPKISATNAENVFINGNEFYFTGVNWLRGREDFASVIKFHTLFRQCGHKFTF